MAGVAGAYKDKVSMHGALVAKVAAALALMFGALALVALFGRVMWPPEPASVVDQCRRAAVQKRDYPHPLTLDEIGVYQRCGLIPKE